MRLFKHIYVCRMHIPSLDIEQVKQIKGKLRDIKFNLCEIVIQINL